MIMAVCCLSVLNIDLFTCHKKKGSLTFRGQMMKETTSGVSHLVFGHVYEDVVGLSVAVPIHCETVLH